MSAAPLAAQVTIERTVTFDGDRVAARTVGAVFAMVTTFDRADSPLAAVPSFAIAEHAKVSFFASVADVNVLPFVGP